MAALASTPGTHNLNESSTNEIGFKRKNTSTNLGSLAKSKHSKEQQEKEKEQLSALNAEYRKIMDKVQSIDRMVGSMEDTTDAFA